MTDNRFQFLSDEEAYLAFHLGFVVRPTLSQQRGTGSDRIVIEYVEDVPVSTRSVVVDNAMQVLWNRCLSEQAKRRQLQHEAARRRASAEAAQSAALSDVAEAAQRAGKASPTPPQG